MRHLRYDNLLKLQNQIEEMNLIDQKSIEICESCMIDRQKRNVNKTSRTSVSKLLEIVHSDLRKSLPRTRLGHAYYITFRDDWSDVIWVHLLRNKNQAFEAFKNFQINTKRSVDEIKIIILRRNNANEYIDQKFQNYLIEQRINWDPRASYVPEQNDEAERLNRTLMYKIRLMLNERKILKGLWDEIIKTTVYLSNRSSHYQHKISYEIIKSKKSDLSHLRIIESTTWVHILKEKIKKLDDRFWKSILVSYESENQYRIYDSRTDKIHIVRDVKLMKCLIFEINLIATAMTISEHTRMISCWTSISRSMTRARTLVVDRALNQKRLTIEPDHLIWAGTLIQWELLMTPLTS
jgi:hypothetical protein